jgi:hypothetical protein
VHWTHVPVVVSHAGVGAAHWALLVQVVSQVFVFRLQVPASPQLVLVVHCTQVFVSMLQ